MSNPPEMKEKDSFGTPVELLVLKFILPVVAPLEKRRSQSYIIIYMNILCLPHFLMRITCRGLFSLPNNAYAFK